MARARDEIREERIAMEAVVDAYDSSERAMGLYYYLNGEMKVPFMARYPFEMCRCRQHRRPTGLLDRLPVMTLGECPYPLGSELGMPRVENTILGKPEVGRQTAKTVPLSKRRRCGLADTIDGQL
jgi:hypothetical protein